MNTNPGLIGKKIGMTQFFTDAGELIPCTVIEARCRVVGKRTQEKDGYDALILGMGERKDKHSTKPVKTAFEKAGQKVPRVTREVRTSADHAAQYELGQELKVEEIFEAGQFVDVQSRSKGRGFTGVMRKHNFAGAKSSHGAHEWKRHGGSIGTTTTPGRVLPGKKMAGQHGNATVTVLNQKVVQVVPDKQLVLVSGGVPGSRGSIVRLQRAVKKTKKQG